MNAAVFVDQSREWARAIVEAECRGPGDHGDAIKRVARKLRLPASSIWALFYRPPKSVAAHVFAALREAHETLCEAQIRKFNDELGRTKAQSGLAAALVGAARSLAGEDFKP